MIAATNARGNSVLLGSAPSCEHSLANGEIGEAVQPEYRVVDDNRPFELEVARWDVTDELAEDLWACFGTEKVGGGGWNEESDRG